MEPAAAAAVVRPTGTTRHRRVTLAVVAVLALGCGSSSTSSDGRSPSGDDNTAGACPTGPGIDADTVRVGAIHPTTGPLGPIFGPAGDGLRARFAAENDAGGVGGRRITVVHADDGDGELANESAARHLVATEGVFGIIEISLSADGSAGYLHEQGVPVTGWALTPAWGRHENMFGYRHSTSPEPGGEPVTRAARVLAEGGGRRLAVLGSGTDASVNAVHHVAETAPALGLEVVHLDTEVPLGAVDLSVQAAGVAEADADALYLGIGVLAAADLLAKLADLDASPTVVVMGSGYDTGVPDAFGEVLDGVQVGLDLRPFELPVPAHDRFRRWLDHVAPGTPPSQLAMVGWLSADTFVRGLHEAGTACPTRAAFRDGLWAVDDHTADGLVTATDFSEEFGEPARCMWFVTITPDGFEPAGTEPVCGTTLEEREA